MLTEAERRGAIVVAALLMLGAGYDLWRDGTAPPAVLPADPPASGAASAPAAAGPRAAAAPADTATGTLDLNRAGVDELDRLPGIGPTLARRIVDHRRAHGPFREVDELLAVRGIGPRLMERIAPRLMAGPGPADTGPDPGRRGAGHPRGP